jgi:hypothetical protein
MNFIVRDILKLLENIQLIKEFAITKLDGSSLSSQNPSIAHCIMKELNVDFRFLVNILYVSYIHFQSSRDSMLCCAVLCCAMLCGAMLCYAMLCYAMLCCAVLCYAMLCYAMLCYAMLCLSLSNKY